MNNDVAAATFFAFAAGLFCGIYAPRFVSALIIGLLGVTYLLTFTDGPNQ